MGMLGNGTPGDMGQDDSIGENDFGGELGASGLGGMDPETGMANIGSWATAKDPNRTMDQVMGMFDDDPVAMAKGYGPKGIGYQYSDSFSSKNAKAHTAFMVSLMEKSFQAKYGKSLKDSRSVYDAMTEEEQEAMIADAKANTTGILSGIPANMRDDVAMGISVTIADMMGYGPKADTKAIPDFLGLPKVGYFATIKDNLPWTGYKAALSFKGNSLEAQIANFLGEDPSQDSNVTAMDEGGESNQ